MAEKSGGEQPAGKWTCINPQCGKELPGSYLSGMRFCPWCCAEQGGEVQRCNNCSVELKSPKDAVAHSKICKPKQSDVKLQDSKLTSSKINPPSCEADDSPKSKSTSHRAAPPIATSDDTPPTGVPGPPEPGAAPTPSTGGPSPPEPCAAPTPPTEGPCTPEHCAVSTPPTGGPGPPEHSATTPTPPTEGPCTPEPCAVPTPPTGGPGPPEPSATPPTGRPGPSDPGAPPTGGPGPHELPTGDPSPPTSSVSQGEVKLESSVQETTPVEQSNKIHDKALVTGKPDNGEEYRTTLKDDATDQNTSDKPGAYTNDIPQIDTKRQKRKDQKRKQHEQEEPQKKQHKEEEKRKKEQQREEERRKQEAGEKQRKEEKKKKEQQREEEQKRRQEARKIDNKLKEEEKKKRGEKREEKRKLDLQKKEEQKKQLQEQYKTQKFAKSSGTMVVSPEQDPLQTNSGGDCEGGATGGGTEGNDGDGYTRTEGMEEYRKSDEPGVLFTGTKNHSNTKSHQGREELQASTGSTNEKQQRKYDHQKHPSPRVDLRGLNAKHSIAVTFHCILPTLLWGWDETSCMHMRFEGLDLGEWKENVGEFKQERQIEEGVFEMTCTLHIDANIILKYQRGYKYVIYSPIMVQKDDCFEYLHTFTGSTSDPNRCLKVSPADLIRDEYHQYDYFVYPKATKVEKGYLISQAVTAVFKWFFPAHGDDKVDKFTPLPTDEMMSQCLLFYLEPCKDLLLHNIPYPENFRIDDFMRQVKLILQQHKQPVVKHAMTPSLSQIRVIKPEFKKWMEEVVEQLQFLENPKYQFISSMCIACCSLDCGVYQLKQEEFVSPLLKMLRIQPDVENKSCPNVSYLFEVISQDSRHSGKEGYFTESGWNILRMCE